MQTVGKQINYIEGIFVQELKNRFLCEVLIDGVPTVCYVPSSCHLSNFLALKGKRVLLIPTQNPNARTKYALFAMRYKRSHILLNTSMANKAVENSIYGRRFSFLGKRSSVLTEHTVYDYKADIYVQDTNSIVEVKSVISTDSVARFPTVFSERTQKQLRKLQQLLLQGKPVFFLIVSLCPYVQKIVIDENTAFYDEFSECIKLGMKTAAYTCRLIDSDIMIDKKIPVIFNPESLVQ